MRTARRHILTLILYICAHDVIYNSTIITKLFLPHPKVHTYIGLLGLEGLP